MVEDGTPPPPAAAPQEDCLTCRLVGSATCLGVAAWVASPAPGGAPRGVRFAAAAVLVGLGVARAVV